MPVHALSTNTWSIQLSNTAYGGRLMVGAMITPSGAVAVRDGVLVGFSDGLPSDLRTIQDSPTPSMWLRLYPGRAVVSRGSQGPYLSVWDNTVRVQLDPSDATNPRIDLVIARVYDPATLGTDDQPRARVEVVTGTPAATPVAPYDKIPSGAGYTPLAEVRVNAGVTQVLNSNITLKRKGTSLRGGVRVLLEGDSLTDPGVYQGELTDTGGGNGAIRRWNGSAWSTLITAGPPKFIQADLLRSAGDAVINGGPGLTDLKVFNAMSYGAPWGTTYAGRGISLNESGLYEISGALGYAINAPHYVTLSYNSDTPLKGNVLGAQSGNAGFGWATGSDAIYIPPGGSLGLTFKAYNSTSAEGTLNPDGGSRIMIRKIGEAV